MHRWKKKASLLGRAANNYYLTLESVLPLERHQTIQVVYT